jgi:hypothetical protein
MKMSAEKSREYLSECLKGCLPPEIYQAAKTECEIYNKLNPENEKDFYGFAVEFLLKDYLTEYVYVLQSMDSLFGGILSDEDKQKLDSIGETAE